MGTAVADIYHDSVSNSGKSRRFDNQNNNINMFPRKENPAKPFRKALPQILAVTAKNLLVITYGMTLGLPSIAIPALQEKRNSTMNDGHPHDQLTLDEAQISIFSSLNLICVPIGCLLSGVLTQPFGRKRCMIFLNLPFIVAFLSFCYSSSVPMLYTALIISGLSGGLLEAPVLTYVAEITEPHLRGMLSATASMTTILGTVSQLLLGNFFTWRTVALIDLFFPVAAIVALCFVPESPHWLISKGRITAAEKALCWLRGWVEPDSVQSELSLLQKSHDQSLNRSSPTSSMYIMYMKRTFLIPFLIITMSYFIGHFGGMTVIQTYVVSIFEDLGAPIDKYFAAMLFGLVELAGALTCVGLIHYTGKRPLTMFSTVGCGICLFGVATCAYMGYGDASSKSQYSSFSTMLLLATAYLSHASIRLLPWIMIGEIYPAEIKGMASGASASVSYIFAFTANISYDTMIRYLSLHGTMYFYSAISLLGSLFLYYCLPETENRTLHEIENHFANKEHLFKKKISKTDILHRKDEKPVHA
ncbi:facilitated trehalose transporter Tret1 isoform X2 [Bemisia tabaci]|uniref:facilitated trehalose transporter Tret1 isoform X2 n=1 Tax=Bemisia tabaci TaxID=7038 RepID=UPI0008F99268|nr:PREDICTED: facilitated trehalose transporter Tret1 isoform X2 [Bemisia tabaci]